MQTNSFQFFLHVEECEWAIEVCKEFDLPIAAMITVGPLGDFHDVPPGECAVRMARAGADVVGTNCYFDPRNGVQLTFGRSVIVLDTANS